MWTDKCGTYGVASAKWYWGRMAALLIRLCYQLHEAFLWILVFVDDFMLLLDETGSEDMVFLFLMFLMIVGCPISWQKNYLSPNNIWLGYAVDVRSGMPSLPSKKLLLVIPTLEHYVSGGCRSPKEAESDLGRLQWVAKAYPKLTPFLQPMYSWAAAIETSSKPGKWSGFLQQ